MPERARSDRAPSIETVLPVFAFKSPPATNGSTTPSSFAGHGMPCPYYRQRGASQESTIETRSYAAQAEAYATQNRYQIPYLQPMRAPLRQMN